MYGMQVPPRELGRTGMARTPFTAAGVARMQRGKIMTTKLRILALAILAAWLAFAGGQARAAEPPPPIVFVHGNGDTAALWITTIWRFESNGYPRDRLTAIDLRYPTARTVDDQPQAGRSSAADVMHQLAEEVARVRQRTGADKVILIAQSRGGNTVRNYLKNGGGAGSVSAAVLCGAVNHGVIVSDQHLIGSEFNGASSFMRDLNSTPGEILAGVRFMTIRSDSNDKYAQPDGRFIGLKDAKTGLGYDAPALAGATNVVLAGADHRETGYAPAAFAAMYKFVADREPTTLQIVAERQVALNGKVTGFENGAPTNIAIAGATVTVHRVSPQTGERLANAAHRKITAADGLWGPFQAEPNATYEFVLEIPGSPTTHIYRSLFPRSSEVVHLRPQVLAKDDAEAGSVVYLTRPRGYFGVGRDTILLDGSPPSGIAPGVPSVSSAKLGFAAEPQRSVVGRFNDEQIAARTWPLQDNHVSVIELTY
jgi:triacylglycerol lipase